MPIVQNVSMKRKGQKLGGRSELSKQALVARQGGLRKVAQHPQLFQIALLPTNMNGPFGGYLRAN